MRGISLVELMVGVVIGMAAIVLIMETFSQFEGRKRTNTTGNDATTSGAFALFQLTREIETAGYGIVTTPVSAPPNVLGTPGYPTVLGCSMRVSYTPAFDIPSTGGIMPVWSTVQVAPVVITDGGTGSDEITIMYGAADALSTPVEFASGIGASYDDFNLKSNVGLNIGDAVIVTEMSATATPAKRCFLAQITGPGTGGAGAPIDPTGLAAHRYLTPGAPFNQQPLEFLNYVEPRLVNLGQKPTVVRYRVVPPTATDAGQLVASDQMRSAATATVVADEVVNLQAQYGIDTNQDDSIDQWVEPTGAWDAAALTPLRISQIKSVRIGIMIRSAQMERPDASGTCAATPSALATAPVLAASSGAPASAAPDLGVVSDWQCFRYKTYEATIPVRNMIWSGL